MNRALRIKVGRCGLAKLQYFRDLPDGNLYIVESGKQLPFDIKRVYFINSLANKKAIRGKHAHKTLKQVVCCISGSFMLHLDDGTVRQRVTVNEPSIGIFIGPLVWHTMSCFSYDCVILVLASAWFDETDYIRDYGSFLESVRRGSGR